MPHQAWLAGKVASNEPLFPTTIVLALTILGAPLWLRNRRVRWAAVLLAAGILLSLGPTVSIGGATVPGPFNLLRLLPGGALLRTPSRLGVLALLGFALLAAASWAALERRIPRAQLWSALAIAAVIAETYPVGLARSVASLAQPPPTAQWLAAAPIGPVLELPWDHETADYGATYIYWSTYHWQPMVNGWGAFEPRGPFGYGVLGKLFPQRLHRPRVSPRRHPLRRRSHRPHPARPSRPTHARDRHCPVAAWRAPGRLDGPASHLRARPSQLSPRARRRAPIE